MASKSQNFPQDDNGIPPVREDTSMNHYQAAEYLKVI